MGREGRPRRQSCAVGRKARTQLSMALSLALLLIQCLVCLLSCARGACVSVGRSSGLAGMVGSTRPVIEQLLKSTPAVTGRQELERSRPASSLTRGTRRTVAASARTYEADVSETPIVLTLEDDDDDDAPPAPPSARSVESACAPPSTSPPSRWEVPQVEDWTPTSESQIYLIAASPELLGPSPVSATVGAKDAGTPVRKPRIAGSPSTPLHRRKSPRVSSSILLDLNDTGREEGGRLQRPATAVGTSGSTVPILGLSARGDWDADARFWTGGSRYEVDNAPWKIQSWLMHGLKQKLLQLEQA